MASYKVAQDVEAEDKLLGPFTFRQFIYLIIVSMSGALAYGLWSILPPLAIFPLPIIIFFGALALPLRKDQPMETYLAAMISYYLKPRKRLWEPDGIESLVEITVPRQTDDRRTKGLSQTEAEQRLGYLAQLADTRGWAIRNVGYAPNTSMRDDVYADAQHTEDILSDSGDIARSFDSMISAADARRRQEMVARMQQPTSPPPVAPVMPAFATVQASPIMSTAPQPTVIATPQPAIIPPPLPTAPDPIVTFNPYPTDIRQTVIEPLSEQPPVTPVTPVTPVASPQPQLQPTPASTEVADADIMDLANNHDLSIETIAHEADRRRAKKHDDGEVVISLR